jgi:invasion protein IalB
MMKNLDFRACCYSVVMITCASPAMAQEPQQTTATYDDWVMQCNIRQPAPPAEATADPKAADAKAADPKAAGAAKPAEAPKPAALAKPERFCEIVQTFAVRGSGPIARIALSKQNGSDDAVAVFQAPVGVYLPDGAVLKVDDVQEFKGAYVWCGPDSCLADITIAKGGIDKIKAGQKVVITFTSGQRSTGSLPVSTKGLAAAFDAAVAEQAKPIAGGK